MNTDQSLPKGLPKVADGKNLDEKKRTQTFAAFESEIALWQRKAEDDHRPLSQWIRLRLLEADARDEQQSTRYINSPSAPADEKA